MSDNRRRLNAFWKFLGRCVREDYRGALENGSAATKVDNDRLRVERMTEFAGDRTVECHLASDAQPARSAGGLRRHSATISGGLTTIGHLNLNAFQHTPLHSLVMVYC